MRSAPAFPLLLAACAGLAGVPVPGPALAPALDLAPAFGEGLHGFVLGAPAAVGAGDELLRARYADGGRRLVIDPGGRFTSHTIRWSRPFDELLLSWNVDVPEGAGFAVEVSVADAAGWSPWLYLGDWGPGLPADRRRTAFEGGRVEVDVFRASRPFERARYRIHATGERPVAVHALALCFTDTARLSGLDPGRPSVRARLASLAVPPRSQRGEDAALAPRICSPTSVAMVLAHHGVARSTAQVAALLYDADHDLYGNWPRAVQGAFVLGVSGTLVRLSSWRAVEHFLGRGIPLVVSVEVEPGELRGAPYERTAGHLLVITGFDASGDVRVNDPAARDAAGVGRIYTREDLERVWMRKGGVAYAIGPR